MRPHGADDPKVFIEAQQPGLDAVDPTNLRPATHEEDCLLASDV
jgi:hypothetical protein